MAWKSLSDPQMCRSGGHLYNGHPIPTRQPDLEYFSKLLLCLENSFPNSGFPPVCAFIKQKGSSTIHHLGITVCIMNIYQTIPSAVGNKHQGPGRKLFTQRSSWRLLSSTSFLFTVGSGNYTALHSEFSHFSSVLHFVYPNNEL